MNADLTIGRHHFRIANDTFDRTRLTVSHAVPGRPGDSHSVGTVGAYRTVEAATQAAAAHVAAYDSTGNCDGAIPVRPNAQGKVHLGWLDRDRTYCGVLLGKSGAAFRVSSDRGLGSIDCGRCR